ncbi:uncharacterized protein ACA1_072060 [Acanthamoeba castellanii str. Neff]|uniref:Uncharacterized protein n=1 Tax=Acanthamoeba castellanii (strain ATCC 30010 / Neff) TaxID=1257118 RepID=L8HDL3_ACACF|nr:uncharacterized protein ACA1_072060 [Acanthamoeba castellanii str. Neff]ELR23584.1 hypothetical protein ACA1_072060 [Acanthamoeba castellanii str. Neff]
MEPSAQDAKGRRRSTGGILRRPPEDNIEQEAVLTETRAKAQSKFQSRPDQRLDKTARSKKKKASKGVKSICENLLGNFRKKNSSSSGSSTTVTTVNPIKLRSSSDADALRPGGAADYAQTRRDSQLSSILTSSGPSSTSTPTLSPPVAGSLPSRSASTSSVASPTISQADDAAHVAMPRRATAFAPRAVVISAQATEGGEREMTLEEEAYLMAMMEGDATGVARARRNTVITKREPGAVEEGRRRHQRRDFKVTHVEFPDEGSYGRGFHEDVDLTFVAKGDALKDYVWGAGGASALDSSEEEGGGEEEQEEGGEEGEEGDGKEEEEEDASLEELEGSDSIETEAEEEEETPPDDLVASEDGEEEEEDEKDEGEVEESKEKQKQQEGQGAARGKRKRRVTGDESGTSAETRTELKERVMAENETEEATGLMQ